MCRRKDGPQNTCSCFFLLVGSGELLYASDALFNFSFSPRNIHPETVVFLVKSTFLRTQFSPPPPSSLFLHCLPRASRTAAAIWDSLRAWGTLSREITSSPVTKFQLSTLPALAPLMASTTKLPAPSPLSPSLVQAVSSRCPRMRLPCRHPCAILDDKGVTTPSQAMTSRYAPHFAWP